MRLRAAVLHRGEADENGNITGTAEGQEEITVNRTEYGSKELPLERKQLEGLQAAGVEDAFYCNLKENIKIKTKSKEQTPVLVCKDPVYDITYYVNYGRDNYIYAYRNQTSELAVAIPARDLFLYRKVRFLSTRKRTSVCRTYVR